MDAALTAVADITANQYALVTWQQLRDEGLTEHEIRGLAKRRVLKRERPEVYGIVGAPDSWERGLLAAMLSVGDDCVASKSSAARLWGFAYLPEGRYEITVPNERRPRLVGVRIHRTTQLDEAD